jgi:hypothetical protein
MLLRLHYNINLGTWAGGIWGNALDETQWLMGNHYPDADSDRSALSLIFDPLPIFTTRFSLPDVLKHARGL